MEVPFIVVAVEMVVVVVVTVVAGGGTGMEALPDNGATAFEGNGMGFDIT